MKPVNKRVGTFSHSVSNPMRNYVGKSAFDSAWDSVQSSLWSSVWVIIGDHTMNSLQDFIFKLKQQDKKE